MTRRRHAASSADGRYRAGRPLGFLPLSKRGSLDMFGNTHVAQLRSQPVHFVEDNKPPMLLLMHGTAQHGTTDEVVLPRNVISLAAALQREPQPMELKMYPGIGHAEIALAESPPFRGKARVLEDAVKFIKAHTVKTSTQGAYAQAGRAHGIQVGGDD